MLAFSVFLFTHPFPCLVFVRIGIMAYTYLFTLLVIKCRLIHLLVRNRVFAYDGPRNNGFDSAASRAEDKFHPIELHLQI